MRQANAGYFRSGLPYNRFGHGPRPLVIFQGLMFENKPQSGLVNRTYNFLGKDYTVASVLRKPGMPQGYTMDDMANDYATMIRDEFGGPVDVNGSLRSDHHDRGRRSVQLQGAPRGDHGANPGGRGRTRSVLLGSVVPGDCLRHPERQAHPVPGYGSSGLGQAV